MSKVICIECWNSTDVFHKFYQKIMYVQNSLSQHLKTENHGELVLNIPFVDCQVKKSEIINEYKIEESFELQNSDNNEDEGKQNKILIKQNKNVFFYQKQEIMKKK